MLKVTHVYAWGGGWSGAENILATLARCSGPHSEMLSDFVVAPARDGRRLIDELHGVGAKVEVLPDVRPSRPGAVLQARRRLTARMRETGSELAVLHSTKTHLLFAPILRAAKIPLVYWAHGGSVRLYDKRRAWRIAVALMERCARVIQPDLAICVSRFCATELLPTLFPNRAVRRKVIYAPVQPVDTELTPDERKAIRLGLDTDRDSVVLIQASRPTPWKGHELLLNALARIGELRGWVYWLVGGPQTAAEAAWLAYLRHLATSLGIAERVRFVGQRNDVPKLLKAADIHCQPNSRPEPFSIALVEAMSAGLPAVGTALGGSVEIVDESSGVLVKAADAEALARALSSLIKSYELRVCLGAGARRRSLEICDPATQFGSLATAFAELRDEFARGRLQSGVVA